MDPTTPLFDFGDTFPASIAIGDTTLPIHVKRYTRAEWFAFVKGWNTNMASRGTAILSPEEQEARDQALFEFCDKVITDSVTIDRGLLRNRGEDVTTGSGLVDMFFNRVDVLGAAVAQIYQKNSLNHIVRKNSNSPRVSEPGSETSIPTRGGGGQGSTVASAAPPATAVTEGAMDGNSGASSGPPRALEERQVH